MNSTSPSSKTCLRWDSKQPPQHAVVNVYIHNLETSKVLIKVCSQFEALRVLAAAVSLLSLN